MSSTMGETSASPYESRGILVVRHLVPADLCDFLTRYLAMLASVGRLETDPQIPSSQGVHGDAAFDTLLEMARPAVADLIGHPLIPTYSYARLYRPGSALRRHTDRGACEHSVTINLGRDQDEPWPISVRDLTGSEVDVDLEPGDGLCYLGRELEHWREPFTGRYHAQVFLHYVDADSPDAGPLAFDGRPSLGRELL
jgi:hypothetical protein